MTHLPTVFRQSEGRNVWESGSVVIAGTLHRVQSGFVFCDSSLNRQAWNVTEEHVVCPVCYPAPVHAGPQLELFR